VGATKIYLRDLHAAWYHLGLQGLTRTVDETAELLGRCIDEQAPERVVTIGNSAGGYAAILFGALLKADAVLAFVPQTCIGRRKRLMIRDSRRNDAMWRVLRYPQRAVRYMDLRHVPGVTQPDIHIFFCGAHGLDKRHAERMRQPNVVLERYAAGGHHIARMLKRSGELKPIVLSHIETSRP